MGHLNELVPELLGKLKVVEEKKPVNNVTANIMRIRELIAQARSIAKKASGPFSGYTVLTLFHVKLTITYCIYCHTGLFSIPGPSINEIQRSVLGGGPASQ